MCKYYQNKFVKEEKNSSLDQIVHSANLLECAEIMHCHSGLVIFITSNLKEASLLNEKMKYFSFYPTYLFPPWEMKPYENYSPSHETISKRISVLYQLSSITKGSLFAPIDSLIQKVFPNEFLENYVCTICRGQSINKEKIIELLKSFGYREVKQIIGPGELCHSEYILESYPIGFNEICQITFHEKNRINNIRLLKMETREILKEIKKICFFPVREFPLDQTAIEIFSKKWMKHFGKKDQVFYQVNRGIFPAGIEYWQPLFFGSNLVPIFQYFPKNALIVFQKNLKKCISSIWENIKSRYKMLRISFSKLVLQPNLIWIEPEKFICELKYLSTIQLKDYPSKRKKERFFKLLPLPNFSKEISIGMYPKKLDSFLRSFNGTIIFLVKNECSRKKIKKILNVLNLAPKLLKKLESNQNKGIYFLFGSISIGFIDLEKSRSIICEKDLLGDRFLSLEEEKKCNHSNRSYRYSNELKIGDPVVHIEYGIGRYEGLQLLETDGIKKEYLVLIYADHDKLYVPVSSINLISNYIGKENPTLHSLRGKSWKRIKSNVTKKVYDIASELLDVQAKRKLNQGFSFQYNQKKYQLFCRNFHFDLTIDQIKASEEVLNDMCKSSSMDRLICGDVGFGKTEVAMRATFLAIDNHKQVAILVPTTLLAQQHLDNFRDRFLNWPTRIEMISRFLDKKEQKKVLKRVSDGKVDVLIGTHKLLTSGIKWKDLGLLIIDEEHRFGVKQKEKIKKMRTKIDVLTMTATPIPRTLYMAMQGIRDFSIISTPPAYRMTVKTFIKEHNDSLIREAILREIHRGGQVYYLHNSTKEIEQTALTLNKIVPEARIAVGHGKMNERDLEQIMEDFYQQRFNVLVCTTIIETGIDVSNANTIIIERSDKFGLAQLYQLRGRVGRSYHQAYAYFLVPSLKELGENARKRIESISSLRELGVGFSLSMDDLEIRGAGELLGENQSGKIKEIGLSLYLDLLDRSIRSIKGGNKSFPIKEIDKYPEIELHIPTFFPEDYIKDVDTRLIFYKKIAFSKTIKEVEEIRMELIEQFGPVPLFANYLITIHILKILAKKSGIRKIQIGDQGGFIEFHKDRHLNIFNLIGILENFSHTYFFTKHRKIKLVKEMKEQKDRLKYIESILIKMEKYSEIERKTAEQLSFIGVEDFLKKRSNPKGLM